jgi:hypothetical protein
MEWPNWLAALAAILAVAVSVTTYAITNKRDEKRWRRDSLLDAMAGFLDGSFQRYSLRAFNLKREGGDTSKYDERSLAGRHQQNSALTRLRLLAPSEIVEAAELVRAADDEVAEWFTSDLAESLPSTWSSLNDRRQAARTRMLSAYRHAFGLGRARTITSSEGMRIT